MIWTVIQLSIESEIKEIRSTVEHQCLLDALEQQHQTIHGLTLARCKLCDS